MVKKKVLSVCGTGGVTSGVISKKVKEIAEKNKIDVDITNSNALGVQAQLKSQKYDLIVSSTRIKPPDNNVPIVNCMSFLIGENEEETIQKILEVLTKE